jgi:hypothetical protein
MHRLDGCSCRHALTLLVIPAVLFVQSVLFVCVIFTCIFLYVNRPTTGNAIVYMCVNQSAAQMFHPNLIAPAPLPHPPSVPRCAVDDLAQSTTTTPHSIITD